MPAGLDETAIRHVIAECVTGASTRDLNRIRPFLAEDVVYFLVGEPPLRGRELFLASMQMLWENCTIAAEVEIQELHLMGDHAYCVNWLALTITPHAGGTPMRRAGHTITLLRREANGRWVVFRNANLLPEL